MSLSPPTRPGRGSGSRWPRDALAGMIPCLNASKVFLQDHSGDSGAGPGSLAPMGHLRCPSISGPLSWKASRPAPREPDGRTRGRGARTPASARGRRPPPPGSTTGPAGPSARPGPRSVCPRPGCCGRPTCVYSGARPTVRSRIGEALSERCTILPLCRQPPAGLCLRDHRCLRSQPEHLGQPSENARLSAPVRPAGGFHLVAIAFGGP